MMPQDYGPFAAGSIDQAPRRQAQTYAPAQAPQPFWDQVTRREREPDRLAARVARQEAVVQGALVDRHRQIEALVGRAVPRSLMMGGQDSRDGSGALSDADYESRIEALRAEFPDRLSAVESRADLAARLSGEPAVTYYNTPQGPATVRTLSDGSLWLETRDGRSGSLSQFPGATPVRRAAPSDVSGSDGSTAQARARSLGERFMTTAEDAANTGPWMAAGRYLATRGPAADEFEDPENPGQTIRFASFGQTVADYERERRDSYRLLAASDSWDGGDASLFDKALRGGVTLAGAIGGSAIDPTSLIAPGRTIAGRIAGSLAVNAATDVVAQGADIGAGIETQYRPEQTVAAALIGGVVQGGFEGAGALARAADPNPGGVVGALAEEIDAGSRRVADPAAVREPPPAVRAALARVDRDRLDRDTIGPVDGATYQATQAALNELRAPLPVNPVAEREIDDLFGGAAARDEARPSPVAPVETAAPTGDPLPGGGRATPGPTAPAGFEAVEYQGRRILSGTFDPMQVDADPARFQYKAAGDEGLTDRLSGVTGWDRTAAGRAILFEDRDGRVIVADGHQRRGLARRLIESGDDTGAMLDGFLFRAADGWTPSDVRVVAALKNIREGAGEILDAAKIFREAPALINDRSLPITGDFVANARGIARLSDDAFSAVAAGVIPDRYGAVIGELSANRPDLHLSMVDLVRAGDPRSLDEVRALVQEAKLADFAEAQGLQGDMFGGAPAQSTLIARAKLRASVLKQLRGDARLFSSLIRNADAIEAGGNALARTENEARLARDLMAFSAIDKLALRAGALGDTFGAAASAVTRGELTLANASRGIVDELREAARLADVMDAERRVNIDPDAPSAFSTEALSLFETPGGRGQAEQVRPKPEDAEFEAAPVGRATWGAEVERLSLPDPKRPKGAAMAEVVLYRRGDEWGAATSYNAPTMGGGGPPRFFPSREEAVADAVASLRGHTAGRNDFSAGDNNAFARIRGWLDETFGRPNEVEPRASLEWDDLPQVGEEQRAVDVLRVCAPGKA